MSGQPAIPGCPGSERLKSWIDGESRGRERAEVQAHLAGCAECREEVRIMERIGDGVREMGGLETPPAGLRARVLAQVSPEHSQRPSRPLRGWLTPVLGSAVVVLIAAILFPVFSKARETARSAPAFKSGAGEAVELRQAQAPAAPAASAPMSPAGGPPQRERRVRVDAGGSAVTPDDVSQYVRGGEGDVVKRRVVQTADYGIRVRGALENAEKSLTTKVTESGGYVENSSLSTRENGERSALLTVRVPVEKFESMLAWLTTLGDVTDKNVRGEDVTGTWIDQRAEVREQRAEEERLLRQFNSVQSRPEREQVRWALIRLRSAIRASEERLAATSKLAALATLRVTLTQPRGVSGAGLLGEMSEAFAGAASMFMVAIRIPLVILVWVLVFLPLWLPCVLVVRWVRRHQGA